MGERLSKGSQRTPEEEAEEETAGSGSPGDVGTTALDPALAAREALPTVEDTRNWSEPPPWARTCARRTWRSCACCWH